MKIPAHLALLFAVAAAVAVALVPGTRARAAGPFNVCVYDPSGESGPAFSMAKDFKTNAALWGVSLDLKAFTNEEQAKGYLMDQAAAQCHAAILTGVTARQIVRYSGTIEALGGLPTYDLLAKAIGKLAREPARRAALKSGAYETIGVFPAGGVYLIAGPKLIPTGPGGLKKVPSVEDLKGKRIATIKTDRAALTMVRRVGAITVDATIADFAKKFINGQADACYAPATAIGPLGIASSLKQGGGVIHYVMAPLTMQAIVRTSAGFPEDFKARTMQWAAANFDGIKRQKIAPAEAALAPYWVELPAGAKAGYDAMFQQVRGDLAGADGVYDPGMLALIEDVRAGR